MGFGYYRVGTDYFTKWVEAKPLANIRGMDAKDFSEKILSLGLESPIPSSWTMDFSLTIKHLGGTAAIWE